MYQMMNEFGTPFNEAEEAMRPKGIGHRHIDKELAASGMESQLFPALIGAVIGGGAAAAGALTGIGIAATGAGIATGALAGAGLGAQVGGGMQAAKAARSQAEAANAASDRQYYYDTAALSLIHI